MASVFKLGRNKGKKGSPWHFEYKDEFAKKRMKKGFTDKGSTQQLASQMENEAAKRRMGLIDPEQEERAKRKELLIEEQLLAFKKAQHAKKNTDKHVKLTMGRIRTVIDGCEWKTVGEMNADEVEAFMQEYQDEEDIGNRTVNHYLQAVDSLGNWLAHPKRRIVDANPFAGIDRRNAAVDIRHALTPYEFTKLLHAARTSVISVQCFSGEERARLYTLSYMTGLRKGEIASLTKSSFDVAGAQPIVTVEAKYSKHRQKEVLPLHPELVLELKVWLKGLADDEHLFPKLAGRKAWKLVKKDLELAGIPYRNDDGVADFHAVGRHTHITELLRNGATLPEASKLARHSTIQMTMKYCHIGIDDQARALASLPAPSANKSQDLSVRDSTRNPGVVDGQSKSLAGINQQNRPSGNAKRNLAKDEVSDDYQCQQLHAADTRKAEDTGLEPATGCPATDFESVR